MEARSNDSRDATDDLDVVQCITEFDQQICRLSFGEITTGALRFMAERLHLVRASVALLRAEGDGFLLFDTTQDVQGVESGRVIAHGSASLSEAVEERRPIYRADIREWPKKNPVDAAFAAHGFLATFSVPLLSGGCCTGTLNAAADKVDGISAAVRKVIELVAPRLAFALEMGRAHDALTESEARFRDVFETIGDGIAVADVVNRKLLMVNSAMCRLLGRSTDEGSDLSVSDLHPPERLGYAIEFFESMRRGEKDHALDVPMMRRDGTEFLADVSARNTTISGKRCVVGVFRDASVRRQREQEQVQIQKLESIRTLAAGIAHDFNNMLTGLVGNVTLAQMQLAPTDEAWELLDEAQRAATRATALTRQLLTFAKGGAPLRGSTNIVQVLRDSANLAVAGTNVQCQFDLPAESLMVLGDEGQLAQVFQNLVRNAVDAMPDGGTVRVKLSQQTSREGDEACIEVGDHGPGIVPELLDKIFVPFFTTKRHGNGMGLAVAYSIVQNHGGRIQAVSTVGVGTTFRVWLAIHGDSVVTPVPPQSRLRGTGRVLVMDDEAIVRQVSARTLQLAGYDVELSSNGRDAVEAYQRALSQHKRFDAVVLDLTVPGGMGGREAATQILAIDPSARLMVSSGYSEDSVMSEYRKHGFSAVLPKPYSARELCAAVQGLLGLPVASDSLNA